MAETRGAQAESQSNDLPVLQHQSPDLSSDEKADEKASSSEVVGEKDDYLDPERPISDSEKNSIYSDTVLVNGEPVITTGMDISRYIVDLRDDGDPTLTFRSIVLGTIFAGLGAALYQVRSIHCEKSIC